jgi:sugar lactone lactonase YvrE
MPSKPSPAPEVQTLLTGLAFGESPRWHTDRLWFADWGKQQVVAVDLDGHSEVMVQVKFPSFPMCFEWCGANLPPRDTRASSRGDGATVDNVISAADKRTAV